MAGSNLDILVAPEFLRQYSMSGDPADRSKYQIGVPRDDEGRGGTKLMHRIFHEGRRVFISKPINHFERDISATPSFLSGGGIGVTPMIALAHPQHTIGAAFDLHNSASRRDGAGCLDDLAQMPWVDQVHLHISDQGTRADLDAILVGCQPSR